MLVNYFIYAPKIIFDFIADILYFIPWWYSRGLVEIVKKSWRFLAEKEEELAIIVWIKNIHKPLHEHYGWQGMLKSVIIRIGQILLRIGILLFWSMLITFKLLSYISLPILVIWQIVYQII